ncbi:MAG: hypothetical protein K940chlam7_00213 [Chlamydiae bacterium]|nr:hypothetical protein [Chlamydiota bacterium]
MPNRKISLLESEDLGKIISHLHEVGASDDYGHQEQI